MFHTWIFLPFDSVMYNGVKVTRVHTQLMSSLECGVANFLTSNSLNQWKPVYLIYNQILYYSQIYTLVKWSFLCCMFYMFLICLCIQEKAMEGAESDTYCWMKSMRCRSNCRSSYAANEIMFYL